MRKFLAPCLLVISLMTASAAQLSVSTLNSMNDTINKENLKNTTVAYIEIVEEVGDEVFDFNTKDYLPVGFNAFLNLEYEVVLEEADEVFDFNTKDYLPVGFGLEKSVLDSIEEIEIEEVDEPFDFDTKKYVPKGFNTTNKTMVRTDLEIY